MEPWRDINMFFIIVIIMGVYLLNCQPDEGVILIRIILYV